MNRRLGYIDTAKGIGIILVVIYHHLLNNYNIWVSCAVVCTMFIFQLGSILCPPKTSSYSLYMGSYRYFCSGFFRGSGSGYI